MIEFLPNLDTFQLTVSAFAFLSLAIKSNNFSLCYLTLVGILETDMKAHFAPQQFSLEQMHSQEKRHTTTRQTMPLI